MADERDPDSPPDYRVYRSRPRILGRRDTGAAALGDRPRGDGAPAGDPLAPPLPAPADPGGERPYTIHRAGRGGARSGPAAGRRLPRLGGRVSPGRVVKWLIVALVGWVALSLVLFLISAQLQRQGVSDDAGSAISGAGYTLTSANTILVLGSDARTKPSREPGANKIGQPSRSDTILLMRAGGGASARLSIPRDTVVDIPGHGRGKINSAYAYGGPALAVRTIEQYLGIDVNHLVEVNSENFPSFIDALGGVDVRTGCVVSLINGGRSNGGYTLRLRPGENHLDGKAALALARTRKNSCRKSENDLTRARRQQKILGAIRSRLLSPATFFRLPLVSWAAPKAVRSDMAGPSLLGLFGAVAAGGSPKTEVLGRIGPDGTPSVTGDVKRSEVARFLKG